MTPAEAVSHADLYTAAGLSALDRHLRSDGVFALWSDDPPDEDFMRVPRMSRIFYGGKFYDYPLSAFDAFRKEAADTPELERVAASIAGALLDRDQSAAAEQLLAWRRLLHAARLLADGRSADSVARPMTPRNSPGAPSIGRSASRQVSGSSRTCVRSPRSASTRIASAGTLAGRRK